MLGFFLGGGQVICSNMGSAHSFNSTALSADWGSEFYLNGNLVTKRISVFSKSTG